MICNVANLESWMQIKFKMELETLIHLKHSLKLWFDDLFLFIEIVIFSMLPKYKGGPKNLIVILQEQVRTFKPNKKLFAMDSFHLFAKKKKTKRKKEKTFEMGLGFLLPSLFWLAYLKFHILRIWPFLQIESSPILKSLMRLPILEIIYT